MKFIFTAFIPLFLCVHSWAESPKYEPIHPEIWGLKPKDSQETGAIIVERRITLDPHRDEYYCQIRILNEEGKNAIGVIRLPDDVDELWGRTVTKEGVEVLFANRKDLLNQTVYSNIDIKTEQKIIIPPGVTSDCVVEFHWREGKTRRYSDQAYSWQLALSYPIIKEILIFPKIFTHAYSFDPGFLTPEIIDQKDKKIVILKNIPAIKKIPFVLNSVRAIPTFSMYPVPYELRNQPNLDPKIFWQEYAAKNIRDHFKYRIFKGNTYKNWAQQILENLPNSTHKAAMEIAIRLEERIKNVSQPTYQEYEKLSRSTEENYFNGNDLDATVKRGMTNPWGMFCIYFQLLQDAKFKTHILKVADRERQIINPTSRRIEQITDTLIGVEEEGLGTIWHSPGMRFPPPGLIHPSYQGTLGISFDTTTWEPKFVQVPIQTALFNQTHYRYEFKFHEDKNSFELNASFGGYPEFRERHRFMALNPESQNRELNREFEKMNLSINIDKAEVFNATNPRENLKWKIEGHQEQEAGRRIEFHPFPGMPLPLFPPKSWPPERKDLIVLPFTCVQLSTCNFMLPKGYKLLTNTSLSRSNFFGKVTWTIIPSNATMPSTAKIIFKIEILNSIAEPEKYEELKNFIAWIMEGAKQTISFEKESSLL